MKGDFSKSTFDAKKHYKDVNMQQGRVLLDTDWNEQNDITDHRIETETVDTIGKAGAPAHVASGFEIIPVTTPGSPPLSPVSPGNNIQLSAGRFYIDGILCENDAAVLFSDQPDFNNTPLPSQVADAGFYMFYLDVWQRHITALEDPDIREVALGGPDTTTRTKTVWQVKYKKITALPVTCLTDIPSDVINLSTGKINARTTPTSGTKDPCGLVTSGGYTGLANQLYRVEIHLKGDKNTATFKWSRDNGSVHATWDNQDNADQNKLILKSVGRDELLGFKSGDWIELIDDVTDLLQQPGILVQIANVDGTIVTINASTIKRPDGTTGGTAPLRTSYKNPRIRRWDSPRGEIELNTSDTSLFTMDSGVKWIKLEDGIEVEFKTGNYNIGDYWLIPARTAKAAIEWPWPVTNPQLPRGITHHYAKLAICTLSFASPGNTLQWARNSDCRPLFPTLTELTSLYYVGGDGQEAMPGQPLPNTLKVGVANGHWPVAGAKVKFDLVLPAAATVTPAAGWGLTPGSVNSIIVPTDPNGIAECGLSLPSSITLSSSPPKPGFSVQVKASLLDVADNVLPNQLPVIFNASLSDAANVYYKSKCTNWQGATPDTVAKALDELCEMKSTSCCFTIGEKNEFTGQGDFPTLEVAIQELIGRKFKDVCLCFLPGDHKVVRDILMRREGSKFDSLRITGCGASVLMTASRMELAADKLVLAGISLNVKANTDANDTQINLAAKELHMDYCEWTREGKSEAPFVYIDTVKAGDKEVSLVYLKHNKFLGFFSLVLADGVQGLIESNLIQFLLLQDLDKESFKYTPLIWLTGDAKKLLRLQIGEQIKQTDWSLTIRGNRASAIVTQYHSVVDANGSLSFSMYQDMIVIDNIIQLPGNSFIAKFLTVSNNQFLAEDANSKPLTVAFLVGFNSIVMGNSGFTVKLKNQDPGTPPVPFTSTIDTITLNMIRGNGIGYMQIFNLLNVV